MFNLHELRDQGQLFFIYRNTLKKKTIYILLSCHLLAIYSNYGNRSTNPIPKLGDLPNGRRKCEMEGI